jgi:5-methylcytosine-specific restriction endonuclease McrA
VLESYEDDVRSAGFCIKIPAVVCLKRYIKVRPKVKFSRKNLYMRDEFTCQYCGRHANMLEYKVKDLNLDHVVPKSRGGRTEWTNIVTTCIECNSRKANRTPEEAGLKLRRKPFEPKFQTMLSIPIGTPSTPKEWRNYLYWNGELDSD